ncbi:hypothetical protein MAJHIDBO_00799 [Propionibacterium freudenreichii subsp. shermanii]|nr:hypothetical protein MAJHIDBO_00799 [Propionibacterium freudenreichii subsp. shermanii]SPS08603.1 hypothetical protein MAJHIDBO_00799 [Propionibacterium freudenreichii subsp. shermanii]
MVRFWIASSPSLVEPSRNSTVLVWLLKSALGSGSLTRA